MDLSPAPLYLGMGPSPVPRPPSGGAFAQLYRAHIAFVWHVVRLAGTRDADIADVVQEVFILLDRAMRGGLDTSRPLRGWLKKTAFRCARDQNALARNREQPAHEQSVDPADQGPTPEESMEVIDARAHVMAILEQLPDEHRMVLVMSDIEEMPMSEIAEVLEIPIGTGYSRLQAGRRTFERVWKERRAGGLAAVAPFALWDARSLLKTERFSPEAPAALEDEVWCRVAEATGRTLMGAAADGGALAPGATKAAACLTAKHRALGALVSALAGAGLHAGWCALLHAPEPPAMAVNAPATASVEAAPAPAPVCSIVPLASAVPAPPTARVPSMAARPCAVASGEAAERASLDLARAMLDRHEPEGARAALVRVRSPRLAAERDVLWRIVALYAEDGGAPHGR